MKTTIPVWISCFVALLTLDAVPWQSALAQEATRADFEEFCTAVEGRWVGDVTLTADFEGIGKQGEKLILYGDYQTSDDTNLLVGKMYVGGGTATWNIIYDEGAHRIRTMFVTSNGDSDSAIIYKQDENWYEVGAGTTSGKPIAFKNKLTISDNGATHTWARTGTLDGKASPEQQDVFQRISNQVPASAGSKAFREFGESIVGLWEGDITFIKKWPGQQQGRGEKVKSYSEYRWINNKHAILRVDYCGDDSGIQIFTWDPGTKQIVDFACRASGITGRATLRKAGERTWIATLNSVHLPDGSPLSGGIIYEFSEDGSEFKISGQVTENAQPLDPLRDVYKRLR